VSQDAALHHFRVSRSGVRSCSTAYAVGLMSRDIVRIDLGRSNRCRRFVCCVAYQVTSVVCVHGVGCRPVAGNRAETHLPPITQHRLNERQRSHGCRIGTQDARSERQTHHSRPISKGFALVFGLGVIVSMLSAVVISRTFLMALGVDVSRIRGKFLMLSGLNK